jgi:hypothetical protein
MQSDNLEAQLFPNFSTSFKVLVRTRGLISKVFWKKKRKQKAFEKDNSKKLKKLELSENLRNLESWESYLRIKLYQ